MDAEQLVRAVRAALDDLQRAASDADGARWYFDYLDDAARDFFDRWTPAAVLRQVAAMREILDEHQRDAIFAECLTCRVDDSSVRHDWPCPTLRALAVGLGINPEEET